MDTRRLRFWVRAGLFLLAIVGSAKFIPVSGGDLARVQTLLVRNAGSDKSPHPR
jgi:hypothetical protein